jgi:uncharacterized protein YndB with AHSA1/START domain
MERWWGAMRDPPKIGAPNGMKLVTYEPQAGGMVLMEIIDDGTPYRFGGRITVFDAPREFTFENDWIPNQGWQAPTYITLRLTPALGGTMVELMHHGFERTGKDPGGEHRGYEGGWGMLQLETLRQIVEGG